MRQSGNAIEALDSASALSLMLAFYRRVRAEGCTLEEDGDMLLFQWGIYDWGNGEFFNYNITRQFIVPSEDYQEISQLRLTIYFSPSEVLRAIPSGNFWCQTPENCDDFEQTLLNHESTTAVANLRPAKVELLWCSV